MYVPIAININLFYVIYHIITLIDPKNVIKSQFMDGDVKERLV